MSVSAHCNPQEPKGGKWRLLPFCLHNRVQNHLVQKV